MLGMMGATIGGFALAVWNSFRSARSDGSDALGYLPEGRVRWSADEERA